MKIIIDTHIHSKASDGVWRPSEVVKHAKARGLKVIALTDHDSIYGVREAVEESERQGIRVIKGTEIDAEYTHEDVTVKDIELLGLCIDLDSISPFIEELNQSRMKALEDYTRAFNDYIVKNDFSQTNGALNMKSKEGLDWSLSCPEVIEVADIINWRNRIDNYDNPTPFLSKKDFVFFMYDRFGTEEAKKKLAEDRNAYGMLREKYQFLWVGSQKKQTFYNAIKKVKEAGGKAIVAHPGIPAGYKKNGMVKEWEEYPEDEWFQKGHGFTPFMFIEDLKKHGLDGLEIYNYCGTGKVKNMEEQERINRYFQEVAYKLELLTTFGSDCHGPRKWKGPLMGTFGSYKICPWVYKNEV